MKEKVVILGGGESGTGAAVLAKRKGHEVFLSDNGLIPSKFKQILNEFEIDFEEGQHSEEKIQTADLIIKSPGVPDDIPLLNQARTSEIPVISEIEFAMRYTRAKVIGVTGTNGKTTTTLLTHHLLKEGGLDAGCAGNVGDSLAMQVAIEDKDIFVTELSSFQLDGMYKSRLHVAILLNITPDHLDRYDDDFQKYVASKFRIAQNMKADDFFIFNISDPVIAERIDSIETKAIRQPVSMDKREGVIAYETEKYLRFIAEEEAHTIAKTNIPLRGRHNMINAMCAVLAARNMGVSWENIVSAIKSFKNVPHRLEYVGEIDGISFYNDSKATNVDAVKYALESFEEPVVLIMGGIDKGNDYAQLDDLVTKKVSAIVTLGIDDTKIKNHFKEIVPDISSTDSVYTAVEIGYSKAAENGVVLLSPACASFDLFKNFEERGQRFKEAFYALQDKIENNRTAI